MKWFKWLSVALLLMILLVSGFLKAAERFLNPDNYRARIVGAIEEEYGYHIDFASLGVDLFPSLKVTFKGVAIKDKAFDLSSEKLVIYMSLVSIFRGNYTVSGLTLEKPSIRISRFKGEEYPLSRIRKDVASTDGEGTVFSLRKLLITEGELFFVDEAISDTPIEYHASAINANYMGGGIFGYASLKLSGNIKGLDGVTKVSLDMNSLIRSPRWGFRDLKLKGNIYVDSFNPDMFSSYIGGRVPESYMDKSLSLEAEFAGIPFMDLDFTGALFVREKSYSNGPFLTSGKNVDMQRFELRGKMLPRRLDFEHVAIQLPEITLRGSMGVTSYLASDPAINFNFETSLVDISELATSVPPAFREEPMMKLFEENVLSGKFQLTDIHFDGLYSELLKLDAPENLGLLTGRVQVRDFVLKLPNFAEKIEEINGTLAMSEDVITFSEMRAKYRNSTLNSVSGVIEDFRSSPVIKSRVDADLDLKEFHSELLAHIASPQLSQVFKPVTDINGNIRSNFNMVLAIQENKLQEFNGEIFLSDVSFKHDLFDLPVTALNGTAYIDGERIDIRDVKWKTGSSMFNTSGKIENYGSKNYMVDFTFDAEGELSEFAKTRFYNLTFFDGVKGPVSTHLRISGNLDEVRFTHRANFTAAEYRMGDYIFKKSGVTMKERVEGRLYDVDKLHIDSADILLGNSEISMRGEVDDIFYFTDFDLNMDIKRINVEDFPVFVAAYPGVKGEGGISGKMHLLKKGEKKDFSYDLKVDVRNFRLEPLEQLGGVFEFLRLKGEVTANLALAGRGENIPSLKGEVSGENIGFTTLLKSPFHGLRGKVDCKGQVMEFSKITGSLGNASGEVSGKIKLAKEPYFYFTGVAASLDLSDIVDLEELPEGGDGEKKEDEFHGHWEFDLKSSNGTMKEMGYRDMEADFTYYRGHYDFKKFNFISNGGRWTASGKLDTSGKAPLLDGDIKVAGLNLKDFMSNLYQNKKITGTLDASGHFTGEGLAWDAFKKNFSGKIDFVANKGLLVEFRGTSEIFKLINILPIFQKRDKEQIGAGLPYDYIRGSFDIINGVMHTENMVLEGDVIRMTAVGDINYHDNLANMMVGVKPFTTVDKIVSSIPIAGEILGGKEKSVITHYYRITGSMDEPKTESAPAESVGRSVLGVFKRLMEFPSKALSSKPEKQKGREDTPLLPGNSGEQ